MTIVHIAGMEVRVGPLLRQRCGWCGATLLDYDLTRLATVSTDGDATPAMWPAGALVEFDGCVSRTIDHEDGAQLPAMCCAQLDPAVTR